MISSFIPLQKKGRDYWACCPFHHEKTPSFQVRSDHQTYKCYGCQKGGNVITFIMDYENLTYPEAIEWLANRAGMEIPENIVSPDYKKNKEFAEKLYYANKEAAEFYFKSLYQSQGDEAINYLLIRGIKNETIKLFGLGYAPGGNILYNYLEKKGFDKNTLRSAGLIGIDDSGSPYDFFQKRLIVPIINGNGKVIGFGGRILKKSDFAKYKNTSATMIFDKKKNLFSINMFKKLKQNQKIDSMILVEGYMDAISLYQAGIKNVVASMGTSLTIEQCRIIKRFVDLVYVSYDGDAAGQKATLRSLDMLKDNGLEVKVISMPEGTDPDDAIRKLGKEGYIKLQTEALPLTDFKLVSIEKNYNMNTSDGKNKYANEAINVLEKLEPLEREIYSEIVANKSGINKNTIINQSKSGKNNERIKVSQKTIVNENKFDKGNLEASRFILSSLINNENFVNCSELEIELFEMQEHRKIFEYIMNCKENGENPIGSDLYDFIENKEEIEKLISTVEEVDRENQNDFYLQSVFRLKVEFRKRIMQNLLEKREQEKDEEKRKIIEIQINNLSNKQPII